MSVDADYSSPYRLLCDVLHEHFAAQPFPVPPGRGLPLRSLTTARFRDAAYDIATGRTYLSGTFASLHDRTGGRSVAGVTRLHADGSWDQHFVVAFTGSRFSSTAPATLLPVGEDLYVGGSFTQAVDADGAYAVQALARINTVSGRLDRSWLPLLPGSDSVVLCLAMLQGEFASYRLAAGLAAPPFLLLCDPNDAAAIRPAALDSGPVTLLRVVGNGLYVSTRQDAVLNRLRRFVFNAVDGSLTQNGSLQTPPDSHSCECPDR